MIDYDLSGRLFQKRSAKKRTGSWLQRACLQCARISNQLFSPKQLMLLQSVFLCENARDSFYQKGGFTVANYGPPTLILLNKNPPTPFL